MLHAKQLPRRECACGCGMEFTPRNSLHRLFGLECAIRSAKAREAKREARKRLNDEREERRALKKRKEAIKTTKQLKAEAQEAFNAFIRYRDRFQSCICCGKPFEPEKLGGSVDAGHFRSIGSAPHLRFEEDNCHAQRKSCNRPGGTTYGKYREGLIARIGLERVERIEADQEPRRYRADDYRRIRAEYKAKLKELRNGNKTAD